MDKKMEKLVFVFLQEYWFDFLQQHLIRMSSVCREALKAKVKGLKSAMEKW